MEGISMQHDIVNIGANLENGFNLQEKILGPAEHLI